MNSGHLLNALYKNSADAIYVVGADGSILDANDEAVRRQQFTKEELLSMKASDLDTPQFAELVPPRIEKLLAEGRLTFESAHRVKGGGSIPVEINASISEYDSRKVIIAIARDISGRKKIEATIQRQNDYLNALNETTLGLINRLDITNLLEAIIRRAADLMHTANGYIYLLNNFKDAMYIQVALGAFADFEHHPIQRGEGIAGHVWEIGSACHIEDYSRWEKRIKDPARDVLHAMAGIPLTSGEKVIGVIGLAYTDAENSFDDEKMWYLGRAAELASLALENARLYEASQRELNERKKSEERLRKLTQAVEQVPVSIVITDREGTIEYVNPHTLSLTGYTIEEIVGANPRVLKSGVMKPEDYKAVWNTIMAGKNWYGEFCNIKKNGDYYWEQAVISPIFDENDRITNFIAIKEDITEKKQLENQLRHSQKMEAIGQLAGGIAHDFNNILTGIIGYATIMQMKIATDEPLQKVISQIIATAGKGANLTQGLLAFSRKQASNPVCVELNGIIERSKNLLNRMLGDDIELVTQLHNKPLPLLADSVQIEQILMNLVTNARDAMPDGGTIAIQTEQLLIDNDFILYHGFGNKGAYALLTVSDTGTGMDEEALKKIYEPFYTTKETGKGTGLGLSIIYGIIKKHKGYIDCHSLPGMGTIFHIYLPLTAEKETCDEKHEEDKTVVLHGGGTILFAEDDKIIREIIEELLQEFGYNAIIAEDGIQAIDKYNSHSSEIRLAIIDAVMPGKKGIDVYREIRKSDKLLPVIFCSGYTAEFTLGDNGDARVYFMAKPFVPKQLMLKIREVLGDA